MRYVVMHRVTYMFILTCAGENVTLQISNTVF